MWKKLFGASLAIALSITAAHAQTNPGLTQGQKLTPAQWNNLFASKQDTLGYTPLNTAGGVMTGRLITAAPGASTSGLNLVPGSTPASPSNGDLWVTSSGFFARVNGVTIGPIGGASASSFAASAPVEVSFPSGVTTYACSTCVTLDGSQALTNKTLTSPTVNGGTIGALTSFGIRSTGSGAFDLRLANTENLTVNRTLTVTLNNADRTINLAGNLTTSGANPLTFTTTGSTNVTLPTTGTLATLAGGESLTNKTISGSTNILGGVTMTLGSDATGDIYYRNSGGVLTRLGVGSNSQVLTLSGGLPSWQPGAAAATINFGTTTVSGTCSASQLFFNNAGTTGCQNQSASLTAGTGIGLSGTTNVTINNTGVTSVGLANNYGITVSGSPVTTTGNLGAAVSLTTGNGTLASSPGFGGGFVDGPTVTPSQGTSGTWLVIGTVGVTCSATAQITIRITDGTNVFGTNTFTNTGTSFANQNTMTLTSIITSPAGAIRMQAAIVFSSGPCTMNAGSNINVVRIG